jgi:hypothetical protein
MKMNRLQHSLLFTTLDTLKNQSGTQTCRFSLKGGYFFSMRNKLDFLLAVNHLPELVEVVNDRLIENENT